MSNSKPNIHLLRTIIVNLITALVAAGLAVNRRKNRDLVPQPWQSEREAPHVGIIIPARNEETNLGPLIETLVSQSYPAGRIAVTVVDDDSHDRTRLIAEGMAQRHGSVRVIGTPPLEAGWTGKSHAMYVGFQAAPPECEWLLFVDADTRHHPLMLATTIARAEETGADLLSLIIRVEMRSFWERVIVPQVGELYTLLVGTMDQVNSTSAEAAANGQFMLIRRAAYAAGGRLPEVHGDVAEDKALAAALKSRGYKVRLEYGRKLVRARVYSTLPEIWSGYTKTLFWASGHNVSRTLVVVAALSLYVLVPVGSLFFAFFRKGYGGRRIALAHAPLQLLPMLALRGYVCRQVGIGTAYALAYPLSVLMGNAMLLYSLFRVVSGKGVEWKGRLYR